MTTSPGLGLPEQAPKLPQQGASDLMQVLEAFALLPFHALAEGNNKSMRSQLHELTGLSTGRIAKGDLGAIRHSTLTKIEAYQQNWLEKQVKGDQEALFRIRDQISKTPTTLSGANAIWASWIHSIEHAPEVTLPLSKAVALVLDELVEVLVNACALGDLAKFQQLLYEHFENHGSSFHQGNEPILAPVPTADLTGLRSLQDWQQSSETCKALLEHLYLDLISTLDAEWGSWYFNGRLRKPLFPLVMVRPQDGLLDGKPPKSRKNLYYRPSRRLLEFLYALVHFISKKKWPTDAPSPKDLAAALDDPSEKTEFTASTVSNHFDGTLKLTLDRVNEYWARLYQHFMPGTKKSERVGLPIPMIILALQWQSLLVQDKGKTFILLDEEEYGVLWSLRREQCESLQAQRAKASPHPGHPKAEAIEWPEWMLSQSSSSS